MKLTEEDYIFDGFAHRRFNPDSDGWRNEIPSSHDYPSLKMASDILAMFEELCEAKREIWELKQQLKLWRKP